MERRPRWLRPSLWSLGVGLLVLATACAQPVATGAGVGARVAQPAQAQAAGEAAVRQAPASATELNVIANEFKFEPATMRVPAGQKVKITLQNKGLVEHDIHAEGTPLHVHARAGQTASGEFTFDTPGEYELICTLPGHKEAGMRGRLIVGESPAATQPQVTGGAVQAQTAYQPQPLPAGLEALPQPRVAPPVTWTSPRTHQVEIETLEVTATLADGVGYTFWTFGGTVPGPMLRVRQGDTMELTLKNAPDSTVTHSIDLHAVTGPGGGAKVTQVPPGEQATFRFQALNPGVYVYHCATPMVAHHIASGMYGLIVVEPPEGLSAVDREYYVMQGDFYLQGDRGTQGLREFAMDRMLAEQADFVLFNGGVGALTEQGALTAEAGETVRIFFGVGGPNLTSSFHVIGEIFDRVHPEGASEPLTNVQTTLVPAGGATMVEFTVDVPGTYILVDHSLGRLEKGGAAHLVVEGAENPEVFQSLESGAAGSGGH